MISKVSITITNMGINKYCTPNIKYIAIAIITSNIGIINSQFLELFNLPNNIHAMYIINQVATARETCITVGCCRNLFKKDIYFASIQL